MFIFDIKMIRTYTIWLIFFFASLSLVSCGSPTYTPAAKYTPKRDDVCHMNFDNYYSSSICALYWNNTATQCDSAMRVEMNKRSTTISPADQCGKPMPAQKASQIPLTCNINIKAASPSSLCQLYYNNSMPACDAGIRSDFAQRGFKLMPMSACGQPLLNFNKTDSKPTNCNLSQLSTSVLCENYWGNKTPSCDSYTGSELRTRGFELTPREQCGKELISEDKVSLKYPKQVKVGCENIIKKIKNSSDPLISACNLHHRSMDLDSIKCKSNIVEIININSKGVGKSFGSCGRIE